MSIKDIIKRHQDWKDNEPKLPMLHMDGHIFRVKENGKLSIAGDGNSIGLVLLNESEIDGLHKFIHEYYNN